MAKQTINIGASANDRSGDPLRTAFGKINANFTELYNAVAADVQIPSVEGNGGKFLSTNGVGLSWDNVALSSLSSPNGNQTLTIDNSGSLETPLLLPLSFTATLTADKYVGPNQSITLSGDAWNFVVNFEVEQNGTVVTYVQNNTPWASNPGYSDGDEFIFTEADHGIPGYDFLLATINIQNPGPFMWTTNLAAGPAPTYPATLTTLGSIKLTADTKDWVFGVNGQLILPIGGDIQDGNGNSVLGAQSLISSGQTSPGSAVVANSNNVTVNFSEVGTKFTFQPNGALKLAAGGDIVDSNDVSLLGTSSTLSTTTPTPGTASVGAATAISVTNGPNPNWVSMGVVTNGINFTFTVDVDGNATVSAINDGGTGHWVGETFTLIGSVIGGTTPADDATLQVTAVDTDSYTALDLTKGVQKLGNGYYTMGNGVEGQLMHFVRTTGATGLIRIYVTNKCRIGGNEYTNNFIDLAVDDIVTFLFTDNAWQAVGGLWD